MTADDGQIDYSHYNEAALLEVFHNLRRAKYPINYARLVARLGSLGYRVVEGSQGPELVAPPEAAGRLALLKKSQRVKLYWPKKRRMAWCLLLIALALLANGLYQEQVSFEYAAIAAIFINGAAATIAAAIGVVFYLEAYRETPSSWWVRGISFGASLVLCLFIPFALFLIFYYLSEALQR